MLSELIRKTIIKIPAPEPLIPEGRQARVDIQQEEFFDVDAASNETISTALFIIYEDSTGNVSERRISVQNLYKNSTDDVILKAYCFEKKAPRTFRADRIVEAVDLSTGQIIENEESLLECIGVSTDKIEIDARSSTQSALVKCRHGLNVLVYLARCDGHFHHSEQETVIHYLVDQCFEHSFEEEYLQKRIRGLYPDMNTVFCSLESLSYNEKQSKKIASYASQIVQADGRLLAEEINFLNEMNLFANK